MPFSIEADRQALTADRDPAPPVVLSEAQRALYRGVLKGLPPTVALSTSILGLAAALAIALDEVDRCNQALGKLKRLVVKGKPHPLIAVRHAASIRAATLSSRLRLLPSGDLREIARAARHNARFGSPEVAESGEFEKVRRPDGSIDWQATEAKNRKGPVQ